MPHVGPALAVAALSVGIASASAAAVELVTSRLLGNIANQVIAGFASSTATWTIEHGRISIRRSRDKAVIAVRTEGLIIPSLGFNPSPDLLARVVCHDASGTPVEVARTQAVPFPQSGDGSLREEVSLPDGCFAPIVLLTGSVDPEGQSPGKFFAVSGF